MSDNPPSEEAIFAAAIELPAAERAAYLDRVCGSNAHLRQDVAALLQSHEDAERFLENPPPGISLTHAAIQAVSIGEKAGDRIGRYKLLQQIGEGGCGAVYMAEQAEPVRRQVALKIIKWGMDTKQVMARFEAERQALALMDHPNVAKVLDAGATETGRPFFVMELVRGVKITEFCDKNNLTTRERLALFVQVCQAIQHAHQKGIIHRDIKPSNILVTLNDGVPLPKVIDFGIAKATQERLTDKTLFTAFEQFIGTPAYMSPEQAEMNAQGMDTRSDIYSLGVLLYELLTGHTPFAREKLLQAGVNEIRRIIREEEPVRPSTKLSTMLEGELSAMATHRQTKPPKLIHAVRGDLDWIAMKALEKDRNRRYETANGFARDVERYLAGEPVTAHPPSILYQFQKTVRRHWFGFAAAAAIIVAVAIGVVVSTCEAIRAHRAEWEQIQLRRRAEIEAAKEKQIARFFEGVLHGASPFDEIALGLDRTALREILDRTSARIGAELTNQPEVEAEIRQVLGSTYAGLDDWKKAEEMERESLRLKKLAFGETNKHVAAALVDWAFALPGIGKTSEAVKVARDGLAMSRLTAGNESQETAGALNQLGRVTGDIVEAEKSQRESLALTRKLDGTNSADAAWVLLSLAGTLQTQGKFTEAEPLARECLELCRKLYGVNHYTLYAINSLAGTLQAEGKLSEAEMLFQEAWETYRPKLTGHNMNPFASLMGLVDVLSREKKWPDAENTLRQGIEFENATTNYGGLVLTLAELADVLRAEGKSAEARSLAERAINVCTNHAVVFPSWDENSIFEKLKGALSSSGEIGLLEPVAAQFLANHRLAGNPDAPYLSVLLDDYGEALAKNGKTVEAHGYANEAIQFCCEHPPTGIQFWMVERALNTLDALATNPDEKAGLEEAAQKLIQAEQSASPDSADFAILLADVAALLLKDHKPDQAQPLITRAMTIIQRRPRGFRTEMETQLGELQARIRGADAKTNPISTGELK